MVIDAGATLKAVIVANRKEKSRGQFPEECSAIGRIAFPRWS